MLGVSILQELDGVPDRQAVEMLRYHAGWNFALNRQIGDEVFHSTSLVNFRNRLEQHQQGALGFTTILTALQEAGLISHQRRQRLDSTQMFGRVAKMSRLDCVRESLCLGLQELEAIVGAPGRPVFWVELWERYVESQVDYRTTVETLGRKLGEAGRDVWQLLEWLGQPAQSELACGAQVQLLRRVFGEQFEVQPGQPAPWHGRRNRWWRRARLREPRNRWRVLRWPARRQPPWTHPLPMRPTPRLQLPKAKLSSPPKC
jgi:hypothetical protein